MTETKDDRLQQVGKNAMASLREMVAALECDYERLEELRDERDGYDPDDWPDSENAPATWDVAYPDGAEELKDLEEAAGECKSREDAEQRIQEDPLSLQFRSGWVSSKDDMEAEEFELLLTTGGPAVRILGDLSDGEASRAYLQVQDWGSPWTDYWEEGISEVLMAYVQCFCFE